jgi:enoyl-CoA hydratase/carnithine racemase
MPESGVSFTQFGDIVILQNNFRRKDAAGGASDMGVQARTGASQDTGAIAIEVRGAVARLAFDRPGKRNAVNDGMLAALSAFFEAPAEGVRCAILSGNGGNFSAGLDLSEHATRTSVEVLHHSRNWHKAMDAIQFGGLPVVAMISGAAMGGGLEIAAACHVRVAEEGARFRLPEGKRGIFVGGGATPRLSRIIGPDRLTEMMLTGRTFDAEEAVRIGLAHYRAGAGEGMALAQDLAGRIAENATLVNYLIVQGVSRIADMSHGDGLFTESLAAALSTTTEDAKEGLDAFFERRQPKFK